jgi:hypothetical protein
MRAVWLLLPTLIVSGCSGFFPTEGPEADFYRAKQVCDDLSSKYQNGVPVLYPQEYKMCMESVYTTHPSMRPIEPKPKRKRR